MSWRAHRGRAAIAGALAAKPRRSRGQEHFYVGRRPGRTEVYVVSLQDVERLSPRADCDEDAFEWGSDAEPAALELAFAILCDSTRREPPQRVCAQFHAEVVADLPYAGFVVGCDDIALWLAAERRDVQAWRPSSRRRRAGQGTPAKGVPPTLQTRWKSP